MPFAVLNQEVIELRNVLSVYVGNDAIAEVALRPPIGDKDEVSFVRLTTWCYALFFEAGGIVIPYLLKLSVPGGTSGEELAEVVTLVQALRTFASHNLGLSDHDIGIARKARDWQRNRCGTDFPRARSQWASCFEGLCVDVTRVFVHCHSVVDSILASTEDGEATVRELRLRLDRFWPRYKFVTKLGEITVRFGVSLNAEAFVNGHIARWRESMEFLDFEGDVDRHMTRVMERDVLNYLDGVLPIDGTDILAIGVPQGPPVGQALNRARELNRAGYSKKEELLEALMSEFSLARAARS